MDSGFSYGDMIVLGAIAAFILLRYRAMLGEKSGRDEVRDKPAPIAEYERVIQLPAARPEKKIEIGASYGVLAETLIAMRGIDPEFSPDEFLEGARAAYEMVIEAHSKNDRDTLKMLLSEDIYQSFAAALDAAQAGGKRDDTTLIAITKAEMTDAKLRGNIATIAVDFTSEQIHLVRNAEGEVIEGNPSHQSHVEDRWLFTRNLTSQDPNWKISET